MRIRRLSLFFIITLCVTLLGGCNYDITLCSGFQNQLLALKALADSSISLLGPLYVFVWAIMIVRKLFYV